METDLSKGGISYGHISVERRSNGVEVCAKLDPKIEELIRSASEGQGSYTNALSSFGRTWIGLAPTANITAYSLDRNLDGPTYSLGNICGPFKDAKGRTNLSFLTFSGISSENGVRFLVVGPAQADHVKEYGRNVVRDVNYFLREYLVPIHIGINIIVNEKF